MTKANKIIHIKTFFVLKPLSSVGIFLKLFKVITRLKNVINYYTFKPLYFLKKKDVLKLKELIKLLFFLKSCKKFKNYKKSLKKQ